MNTIENVLVFVVIVLVLVWLIRFLMGQIR